MIAELIEKEEINVEEIIPSHISLSDDSAKRLASAGRLGNEFKGKATITFNTINGPRMVTTTVWAVTEKYIQLKNNIHIPISCVFDIDY